MHNWWPAVAGTTTVIAAANQFHFLFFPLSSGGERGPRVGNNPFLWKTIRGIGPGGPWKCPPVWKEVFKSGPSSRCCLVGSHKGHVCVSANKIYSATCSQVFNFDPWAWQGKNSEWIGLCQAPGGPDLGMQNRPQNDRSEVFIMVFTRVIHCLPMSNVFAYRFYLCQLFFFFLHSDPISPGFIYPWERMPQLHLPYNSVISLWKTITLGSDRRPHDGDHVRLSNMVRQLAVSIKWQTIQQVWP